MYCFQCGTQNDDNAVKCLQCGTTLQQVTTQRVVVKKNSTAVIVLVIVAGAIPVLIAILGIVAAISIPAYLQYANKSKLVEVVRTVNEIKTAVVAKASEPNLLEPGATVDVNAPDCAAVQDRFEMTVPRQYISNVSVMCNPGEVCTITATIKDMGAGFDGKSLVLSTINAAPDLSQWDWSKSTIPPIYVPK